MKTKNKIVLASALILFITFITIVIINISGSRGIKANTDGMTANNNFSNQSESIETPTDISFHYSEPKNIYGTDFSMMRVIAQGVNDNSEMNKRVKYEQPHVVNILFYNLSADQFRLLFDRKVLILESLSRYDHIDSSTSRLFYTIVNKDNNGDGYLNNDDNQILFSSDKIGNDLFQITNSNENIEGYTFLGKDKLLVTASNPDRDKPREEWKWKYILYNLKTNEVNSKNKFNSSLNEASKLFEK